MRIRSLIEAIFALCTGRATTATMQHEDNGRPGAEAAGHVYNIPTSSAVFGLYREGVFAGL